MNSKVLVTFAVWCLLAGGVVVEPGTAGATFPGGNGTIVFFRQVDNDWEIFTINPDGSGATRLTNSPGEDTQPVWSADGKEIAFDSARTGNREIFIMNADGSGQTRLTDTPQPGHSWAPAWSPDGTRIAFVRTTQSVADIYVMDADGTRLTNLTSFDVPGQNASFPDWSPDGTRILYEKAGPPIWNPDICVMNADGMGKTNLTKSLDQELRAAWSPDGTNIVFARQGVSPSVQYSKLFVMDADGSNQRLISDNHGLVGRLSPDGSKILADGTLIPGSVADAMYVMNPDGTGTSIIGEPWDEIGDWQPLPSTGHTLPSPAPLPRTNSVCNAITPADVSPTPVVTPAEEPSTGGPPGSSDWPNGWPVAALGAAMAAAGAAFVAVEWRRAQ